jgi:hypothetical protein
MRVTISLIIVMLKTNKGSSAMQSLDKSSKIERFLEELLRMIAKQGLDGYSITTLAKNSKVSRAWIYKMFGGSRSDLAREAGTYLGKRFSILENIEISSDSRDSLIQSLQRRTEFLLEESLRSPFVVFLYFRHMGSPDPIGGVIRELEAAYLKKLTLLIAQGLKVDQKTAAQRARLLTVTRMGIVYSWLRNSKSSPRLDSVVRDDLNQAVLQILGDVD